MDELLKYLAGAGDAFTIGVVLYLVRLDRRVLALEIKNELRKVSGS